jgi:hypothetical protein
MMAVPRMKARWLRPIFLAGVILFAFGLLHIAGPSHQHEYGQDHGGCEICHAASQPYLAAAPPAPLFLAQTIGYLLPEQPRPVFARPFVPYGARAPPSA